MWGLEVLDGDMIEGIVPDIPKEELNVLKNILWAGRGIPEDVILYVNDPLTAWSDQFVWTMAYPFIWNVNYWSNTPIPPFYPAFQPPEIYDDICK